ncbi:DEAD/DEAH box helicase [Merismopedia glauca]|uniref:ATP-dependent helicase n=1 Tax=Merismopedia glauca CCAP 1448/3 TaxID=1296344 RepID=A0A2T1BYG4_9CYAN|nr:DEAD/DEAH box helicase [Merismopedia glauca]PSB01076.1 ATP-dependent helicase [Merismopedia glauca CCAP 1448/3]
MATLHGSWLMGVNQRNFFIWGETWRHHAVIVSSQSSSFPIHPLAMTEDELISCLSGYHLKNYLPASLTWETQTVAIPTKKEGKDLLVDSELHIDEENPKQPELQPLQVKGIALFPQAAIAFLSALPLTRFQEAEKYVGGDLLYWVHIARWSLDMLARGKFLPGYQRGAEGAIWGRWQPVLDSGSDRTRLEHFTQFMPPACLAYPPAGEEERTDTKTQRSELPNLTANSPQELILSFLSDVVDAQVRNLVASIDLPTVAEPIAQRWLESLWGNGDSPISAEVSDSDYADRSASDRLISTLQNWTTPVQEDLISAETAHRVFHQFRTCLVLQPPTGEETDWRLEYCLQAVDRGDLQVEAATIWRHPLPQLNYQGRVIDRPQETLLKGLGLALRLYPAIAPSLETPYPCGCNLSPIEAYEFIRGSAWRLQDSGLGVVMPSSLIPSGGVEGGLGLKVTADIAEAKSRLGLQSLLKFKLELAMGDKSISKAEFNRLIAQKTPLVQIHGEWIALQPQDIKAAEGIFALQKQALSLSVEDALRLSTGDSKTIEKLPVVSFAASGVLEELLATLTNRQTFASIYPPDTFKGELRPYQARGVGWLSFLERWGMGACLADDMGLGKTIELIAFLLHLQAENGLENPILIVCPTSVLGNWEREIDKFAPDLKILVYHGDKRLKGQKFAQAIAKKDIVITSYPLVFRDLKTLQTTNWQIVVLDEAQNIKNSEAKQSQAVRQLTTNYRIALTGTPVENRLSELWSIIDFLNPNYLGNKQFFQRRFAIPIEKYGDIASLKTLRSLVQPFILRRLKTDRTIIQDLPLKQEMNVYCGLSTEQATIYQELVDASLAEIESQSGIQRRGAILTLILKLKQICNHPAQFFQEKAFGSAQRSGKLMRLEEMLEEIIAEGDRALIFTQFAECGKLLKPYLEKRLESEILFLYGGTRKQQREEMIDQFQKDPQAPKIFILSLKAGGTGLNLTRANHVFHFDRWWNPAVENQATDRVFRIGQTRNVQVHKFVCKGTLEEKINDIIESKKQLSEQTVDAGEQWLTELDTDKLRNLLLLDRNAILDDE